MTKPETEAETLDRLEAALARIAAHLKAPAPQAQGNAAAPDRVESSILDALDAMIVRLHSTLDAPASGSQAGRED